MEILVQRTSFYSNNERISNPMSTAIHEIWQSSINSYISSGINPQGISIGEECAIKYLKTKFDRWDDRIVMSIRKPSVKQN